MMTLYKQMKYMAMWLAKEKICHGLWCMSGDWAVVWMDTSAIAMGNVVETPYSNTTEDACWLWWDNSSHINIVKLNAVIHGINLAIVWGMWVIKQQMDSATILRWIDKAISGHAHL